MRKLLLILLSGAAGMAMGLLVTQPHTVIVEARAQAAAHSKQLARFIAAFEGIQANYVDQLDQSELVTAAIDGMIGRLDPQAAYFDAKTFRDMQISSRSPAGLGMDTIPEKGHVKVIAPLDETPAAKAGINVNDVITHIDGVPVQGLTPHQVVEKMRGEVNTKVRLTIMREGQDKPVELTLVREIIRFHSVRMRQDGDDIGYIRIRHLINEQTTQALRKAMSELWSQIPADKLKGYVLDLRNIPSGLLDEAVSVADAFLDDGEVVSVRGRNPEQVQRFSARLGDIIDGKPLVVLINGGTASAAEIVAGALQDHKRATVVGTRSFGKGSVPTIVPLGPGDGALRLTTARYFTPAGRSIDGTGIVPDIEVIHDVPANPENDKALKMAYDLLRGITSDPAFPPNRKG